MVLDTASLIDDAQLGGILDSIDTELNLISSEPENTQSPTFNDSFFDFSGFWFK